MVSPHQNVFELDGSDAFTPAFGYWTPLRLRWYSNAILGALVLALVIVASGFGTGRLGGDLPAFYGAGRILLAGDAATLYSHDRQLEAQQGLFSAEQSTAYLYFPYPVFVAVPYAALALLPFRAAYTIHVLLMGACLFAAVRIASKAAGVSPEKQLPVFALAIMFYPLFRAVGGGQNTALSLLIVLTAFKLIADGREFVAGCALGVLWFKPQLALVFLGLALVERRSRVLLGSLVVGAVLYLIGAAVTDPAWPYTWWSGVSSYVVRDQELNAFQAVGFLGAAELLFGVGSGVARAIWVVLSAATISASVWFAVRCDPSKHWERAAIACAACVLISPHALFYEAGLVAFPLFVVFVRGAAMERVLVGVLWGIAFLHPLASSSVVTPVFVSVLGAYLLALREYSRRASSLDTPSYS